MLSCERFNEEISHFFLSLPHLANFVHTIIPKTKTARSSRPWKIGQRLWSFLKERIHLPTIWSNVQIQNPWEIPFYQGVFLDGGTPISHTPKMIIFSRSFPIGLLGFPHHFRSCPQQLVDRTSHFRRWVGPLTLRSCKQGINGRHAEALAGLEMSNDKIPWLFMVYRGWYYPVI